jgi:polyhydroxyalkanoate synthesis regulator phasin
MTETTKTTKEKDFATRLADAGGEAMQKLTDLPMGKALVDGAQQLRERIDELGTRIRAIDPLEKRVSALEERLAELEKKSKPARRRKPAAKKPAAKKTPAKETTPES